MSQKTLTVTMKNGSPTCEPMPLEVDGGDEVVWAGLPVVYEPFSPFENEEGPFRAGTTSKVKKGLKVKAFTAFLLEGGKRIKCTGQIIIRNP